MVDVSVIIPCYNSEAYVEARVREFEAVLKDTSWSWEIVLCDDGSSDRTASICRHLTLESPTRRFRPHPVNRGLGRNVSDGIRHSRGRFVGYADVDKSTSAQEVVPLLRALEQGYDAAEANRVYEVPLASLPFIAHRYLAHHIYAWLTDHVLGLHRHDTQAGFKFFKREAVSQLLDFTYADGWFWDTEIIANAHRMGFRVAEIPSVFVRSPRMVSTVRLLPDSMRLFSQLMRYAQRWNRRELPLPCCTPPQEEEWRNTT